MGWDFWLAIGAGIANFALIYLGWRVTAKRPAKKWRLAYELAFVFIGFFGIGCIGTAAWRNSAVQRDFLDAQDIMSEHINTILTKLGAPPAPSRRAPTPPPTTPNEPPPYTGYTAYDSLSNREFRKFVHSRTNELRTFEQGYQKQFQQIVSTGPNSDNPAEQRKDFEDINRRKNALLEQENNNFRQFQPELRDIYMSLLKRRNEPNRGCVNQTISTIMCSGINEYSTNQISTAADYLDALADGMKR